MRSITCLCAMLLCTITAFTQSFIKGTVKDKQTQTPLAGATISLNGKKNTRSDASGNFTIACSGESRITVTFIGYETFTRQINDCNTSLTVELISSDRALANVEISATSASNKSLLYQPVSITKLSSTELKRGTGLFLDDAINASVPGVSMQRRSVSAGQQFNLRGYGNGSRGTRGISSNFDGQGYKVYLNGIPVTDAEGITLMDDIDFGSVSNVEITKGPAGTLYGLAIAGAVNLKTVKAEKGQTIIGQDVLVGKYGLRRFTTHAALGTDKSSILINYGNQHADGYMVHTASDKQFINLIGEFQPNSRQTISTYFGYTNSYDQRGGELTLAQYASKNYNTGNTDYIKRNGHSNVIAVRTGLSHTYAISHDISNTTVVFATGQNQNVSSAAGWTDKAPINLGLRSSFVTRFRLSDKVSLSGITGIETQYQRANTIGYNMKQNPLDTTTNGWSTGKPYWVINATTSNVYSTSGTTSLFSEWNLALPHDLSVTAGIGYSNMKIYLNDRFNAATATKPSIFDTTYKNMVSPHLAINKVIGKNLSVYASYSTGYKAPVSSYFFITTPVVTTPATAATARVNSTLKPEKGQQFELGTKARLLDNRLNYQLAYFHAVFSDKMTNRSVLLNNTTTAYSYVINGGKQVHNGIEALIRFNLLKDENGLFTQITPFINYAWSDFTYKNFSFQAVTGKTLSTPVKDSVTTYNYSGLAVFGVPKNAATWGVDIKMRNGIYANIYHLYRDGVNIGYETLTGGYFLRQSTSYNILNAKLGYRHSVTPKLELDLFAGIDNITGTQYPYMIFVNQLPDAYLPAPLKANSYGGLNLRYSF